VSFRSIQSPERSSIIDDIKVVISSKPVMIILALSTLFRIIFHFIVLPNAPSQFGPDEGTYAALSKYASQGLPMEEFPLYGAGLYNSAKSITLPSVFLILLGMDELSAVRSVASAYGLASSPVLVLCFVTLSRLRSKTFRELNPLFGKKFLALLSIFTFLPSNFVWSTIGLRESGSQFWLIITFYFVLKLLASTGRDSLKFTLLCSLALTLAYGSRSETASVFSLVALLASIVILFKFRQLLPLFAILLGVFAGQAFTTTPQVEVKESLGAFKIIEPQLNQSETPKPVEIIEPQLNQSETPKPVEIIEPQLNQSKTPKPVEIIEPQLNQSKTPKPVEIIEASVNPTASEKCGRVQEVIQFEGAMFRCKFTKTYEVIKRNPVETLENQILSTQILEYKSNVNAIDAQSGLPARDCQGSSRDTFHLIKCNLYDLPYRLFAFLFRPLIFFDQGSAILTFAALENLGWMILVPLSAWVSLRKRENTVDRFINLSLIFYVSLFASAAALYEGNLGTAFRHKSTILWPLVFILMIAPRILPKFKMRTDFVS